MSIDLSRSFNRSSKSLLANVLDIDDDFRCNHRCNTLPHNPTYYRTVFRQGDDGSLGPVGGGNGPPGRLHEAVSHTCLSSSAEYELALILKELRVITDTVSMQIISQKRGININVAFLAIIIIIMRISLHKL